MKHVSVIIPTFNRAGKVFRAVSSVFDQTFGDFELIVVDDGSRDNTSEVLAPFKGKMNLIRHLENLGVSAARNSGIKASQSHLVAFLDSDDYWLPNKLEVQVEFFQQNPETVICQTNEIWIRNGVRVNPKIKHRKPSGDIFEQSLKLCLVSPSAVMLKRSLFHEVGLFNEDMPVCEDYDLWLRIGCRYPIHLIDEKMVVKEGGAADQLSSSLEALDRFRIRSMINLLKSECLSNEQIQMVHRELEYKCQIYGKGCLKRGKTEEGYYYLRLPEELMR